MSAFPIHRQSPAELKEQIEAERLGDPFLVYRAGDGAQRIVRLEESAERLTVGRGTDTDISLHWDGSVSRVHAELERVAGDWIVVDDGLSRNGTFVNSERVHARRRLRDRDVLRFGDMVVVYRSPRRSGPASTSLSDSAGAEAKI